MRGGRLDVMWQLVLCAGCMISKAMIEMFSFVSELMDKKMEIIKNSSNKNKFASSLCGDVSEPKYWLYARILAVPCQYACCIILQCLDQSVCIVEAI